MGRTKLPNALPPITEKRYQAQVEALAKILGWRAYHTWNSMHSAGGFPDLVLLRRPRVLFVELKSDRGHLTPEQAAWIEDLRASGQEAHVWRPSDWPEVERTLR